MHVDDAYTIKFYYNLMHTNAVTGRGKQHVPALKEAPSPTDFYREMNKTIMTMVCNKALGHWAAMRETPNVDPPKAKCEADNVESSDIEKSLPDPPEESLPFLVTSPGFFGFSHHQLQKAMRIRVAESGRF